MRHGVYSLRGRAGYAAPTPPFSSVWQIARETGSAFKTPHTSLPHHPFGGVTGGGADPRGRSPYPVARQRSVDARFAGDEVEIFCQRALTHSHRLYPVTLPCFFR